MSWCHSAVSIAFRRYADCLTNGHANSASRHDRYLLRGGKGGNHFFLIRIRFWNSSQLATGHRRSERHRNAYHWNSIPTSASVHEHVAVMLW